jgi:hypothetical protein
MKPDQRGKGEETDRREFEIAKERKERKVERDSRKTTKKNKKN